jgi:3-hydroxyacyl-[acyl-carrier-protein] dehydratase
MRYLLIDHITEWKPGEMIRGVKNVAMSEDFLEFHFPKNPIMPGVMLLEALVQMAGWLQAASSDFSEWILITKVRKSNFYGFAFPGDQVALEVEDISQGEAGTRVYTGTGTVKGKKKIRAEFEGEVRQLSEIEDADDQKRFFQLLTRELNL